MTKTEIAKEYRKTHGPDMPTRKLARIMYADHNLLFTDVEDARRTLRYIEGKNGSRDRSKAKNQHAEFVIEGERQKNPYCLPESYQEKREPMVLPKGCNNILLISDLHIPYHDIQAITVALDYGRDNEVNTIFINGDVLDFHGVSKYEKDPKKRSVKQEFDAAREFFGALRTAFPTQSIYWLEGNHDKRWEHFLKIKAPEIFEDSYFHLEERLRLNDFGVRLIDEKTLVMAGKLAITHGHFIMRGTFAPVNSARSVFTKAKVAMVIGHVHKDSSHPEADVYGNVITTYSTGCLSEIRPDYNPIVSNYRHGFAHIIVHDSGYFEFMNYRIENGKLKHS